MAARVIADVPTCLELPFEWIRNDAVVARITRGFPPLVFSNAWWSLLYPRFLGAIDAMRIAEPNEPAKMSLDDAYVKLVFDIPPILLRPEGADPLVSALIQRDRSLLTAILRAIPNKPRFSPEVVARFDTCSDSRAQHTTDDRYYATLATTRMEMDTTKRSVNRARRVALRVPLHFRSCDEHTEPARGVPPDATFWTPALRLPGAAKVASAELVQFASNAVGCMKAGEP